MDVDKLEGWNSSPTKKMNISFSVDKNTEVDNILIPKDEGFRKILGISQFQEGLYIKDENDTFILIENQEDFSEAFVDFKIFYRKNK